MKPAHEPIIVARKPLDGTVAANVLRWGTGALNVDGTRVAHASEADRAESVNKNQHAKFGTAPGGNHVYGDYSQTPVKDYDGTAGRWPPNVVLSHAPDCILPGDEPCDDAPDCAHDGDCQRGPNCRTYCPVAELDRQSGTSKSASALKPIPDMRGDQYGSGRKVEIEGGGTVRGHDDQGGSSRFFPIFRYEPKAPTSERPTYWTQSCECEDACPIPTRSLPRATDATTAPDDSSTSKSGSESTGSPSLTATRSTTSTATSSTTTRPTSLRSPLLITSEPTQGASSAAACGGSPARTVGSSSRSGSLTGTSPAKDGPSTAGVARATLPAWSATSVCGSCGARPKREAHSTVKPVELIRWLVRLVTPPGGTILDPFGGSGTTAEAAILEHFRCILIEREADYLPLIMARLSKPIQVGFDFGELDGEAS